VLFAVLPPKNSDSTGAKAFSAQGFAIAKPHFSPTMPLSLMSWVTPSQTDAATDTPKNDFGPPQIGCARLELTSYSCP
jgi:hypothetical protein